MHVRLVPALLILTLLLSACNLTGNPVTREPIDTTPVGGGKPSVTIISPQSGAEVVADSELLVSANATDAVGVTRVQLIANNQVVKTVSSESPTGDRNMSVVLNYTPRDAGSVNLQVIAYRGAIASDPAIVQVTVRSSQAQVTATLAPVNNVPVIDPNDPTCRALINAPLRLRAGPGTEYDVLTVLGTGTVVPIIGRVGTNLWWQVRFSTQIGWVSAEFTSEYGICTGVPVVVPPATPTPRVTNTPVVVPTTPPTQTPIPQQPTVTPRLPDLVISNIAGPATLTVGGQDSGAVATYAVTITNTGGSATRQFTSTLTVQPGNQIIEMGVVANLGPEESIVLNVDVTFTAAGSYTLTARADSDNNVTEISEVNNIGIYAVTVNG